MWAGSDFRGAKLALLCGAKLLVYLRDDKPTIPFPGRLDLPGGGREGDESPLECVLRELEEEFGISIPATRITWERFYPSLHEGQFGSYFLGGSILPQEVQSIRFGDEGQFWQMMTVREFLEHPLSVESHRSRLMDFMYATGEQFCGA